MRGAPASSMASCIVVGWPSPGKQRVAPGHGARHRCVTATHEPALEACGIKSTCSSVDEDAQPHLGVDRTPEEHGLLHLAGARSPEGLCNRRALPVAAPGE